MDAIMKSIDRSSGSYLNIPEARRTLLIPYDRLDRALHALEQLDRINLHYHDHPEGLTTAERKALFKHPVNGKHYILAAKVERG